MARIDGNASGGGVEGPNRVARQIRVGVGGRNRLDLREQVVQLAEEMIKTAVFLDQNDDVTDGDGRGQGRIDPQGGVGQVPGDEPTVSARTGGGVQRDVHTATQVGVVRCRGHGIDSVKPP